MRNGSSLSQNGEDLSLEAARRRHVELVLAVAGGIRRLAAMLLGISRMTLDAIVRGSGEGIGKADELMRKETEDE